MEWRHTVWPEAKLVYTAITKVANTSIKSALLATFHPDVSRRSPHAEGLPYLETRLSAIRRDHPDHLHVAFVRNPFDRLVSFWADKIDGSVDSVRVDRRLAGNGFAPGMSFAEAARVACAVEDRAIDPHARAQTWWLLGRRGHLAVDLVLRYERIVDDWELLRDIVRFRTGVHLADLPARRVSRHRPFEEYYDDETWAQVAARYAADVTLLGYSPERPAAGGAVDAAVDGRLAAQLARRGASVIDLTEGTRTRADAMTGAGGRYLALAAGSSTGQLVRTGALLDARIPEQMFDTLIVAPWWRGARSAAAVVARRFSSTGRRVVTHGARPRASATIAVTRARPAWSRLVRLARRRAGRRYLTARRAVPAAAASARARAPVDEPTAARRRARDATPDLLGGRDGH